MVRINGLEPSTSCMSSKRSNQLSYTLINPRFYKTFRLRALVFYDLERLLVAFCDSYNTLLFLSCQDLKKIKKGGISAAQSFFSLVFQ